MRRRPSLDGPYFILIIVAALFAGGGRSLAAGTNVIVFRLKSGDRVSGVLISENAGYVVVSNAWAGQISLPLSEIAGREAPGSPPAKSVVAKAASTPAPPPRQKHWKGETQIGIDVLEGAKDREMFYGRFKLAYERPYHSAPRKFFRNGFDASIEYGKTEGIPSSDRMSVSDKTSFDLHDKWYAYSLVGGGYDHIKKIDAQYEAGPGVGYHLLTKTNFAMNVEAGLNYQAQYRTATEVTAAETNRVSSVVQDVYYRLAEDISWKPSARFTLTERLEYFPRVNLSGERMRFETTGSYELLKNLALNVTALDLYDSAPADDVRQNEFQIRSSLGLKF